MANQKTERRKLAESIARSKGIQVKSAMRYLQRIEAPAGKQRIERPRYTGFTPYLKAKIKKAVKKTVKAAVPVPDQIFDYFERVNYNFSGSRLLVLRGRVKLGSGKKGKEDIRERSIKVPVNEKLANKILNAESIPEAVRYIQNEAPYLAEVIRLDSIEFSGDKFGPEDFY